MKLFFFRTTEKRLAEFDLLKARILNKVNNEEIRLLIESMADEIKDKEKVISNAITYKDYYAESKIGWEMDYDIAISILKNEVNSNKLTYTFELINYLLCYLLNPNELKDGFFLMHGAFLRSIDTASIFSKVEKRRYVVYQSNQELYENYIVRDDDLSDEIKSILVLSGSSYSRPFETTEGGICIFQLDKEK